MHGRYDALHHHHHHGHAHDHDHAHGHSHSPRDAAAGSAGPRAAPGHNHGPARPVQWQTPHHDGDLDPHAPANDEARDLDLVEIAFIEGFQAASDPTSFLRLAGVPFEARSRTGARLTLLRVEQQRATDVGAVTPHLGGATFHYAPLPKRLTSRRETLSFLYFDGKALVPLSLAEARALESPPTAAAVHHHDHDHDHNEHASSVAQGAE